MEQFKFTRKKQFTTFLETTVLAKRDEIRQLESMVDNKFIDTLGYFYGIEYTQQYSYEVIFDGYEGRKAIIDNMQRSTLWDMSYHANGLMSKMDYQIKYLQFVIEYGKFFDNYGECIKAWQEFVKNDTIPTKIDTESVENVENFNDETCKKQVEILNAVQKDLQNYQNRQAQKMQLNEEKRTENVENVEENLPNLGAKEFLSVFESYLDMACEELSKNDTESVENVEENHVVSDYERYLDMAYDLAWQEEEEEEEEEEVSKNVEEKVSEYEVKEWDYYLDMAYEESWTYDEEEEDLSENDEKEVARIMAMLDEEFGKYPDEILIDLSKNDERCILT